MFTSKYTGQAIATVIGSWLLCATASANSITTPLTSDANTVGLWNFNSDTGSTVVDSGPNGMNGTAYTATLVPSGIPGLTANFGAAREFTGSSSFIDFGQTMGSKLDLSGTTTATVEAYVELSGNPNGVQTIFDNGEIQLVTITDHLAGFVMQPGGFQGVVANVPLTIGTPYRVGLVLAGGLLNIYINEQSVGSVAISQPIGQPVASTVHTFIGGNILSEYFPGYIDDVRLSNIPRFDDLPPSVNLLSPSTTANIPTAFPPLSIAIQDQGENGLISGVNPASIQVFLNGKLESGLTVTASSITGTMTDPLVIGAANTLTVVASDNAGNQSSTSFTLTYVSAGPGVEYQTDANTLALWHMDELTPNRMPDSSGNNINGYGTGVSLGQGVFGTGRIFSNQPTSCLVGSYTGGCEGISGFMSVPVVQIPGQQFTVETWIQPNEDITNDYQEQVLLDTNQIHVSRFNNGNVRIIINLTHEQYIAETTSPVLPINQLHQLAITWNGNLPTQNLIVYVDGVIQQVFNGPATCAFNYTPRQGYIGVGFSGMLDEMRISSVVRTSFNLISKPGGIQFNTLTPNSSTNQANPPLNVAINTPNPVNTANVHVYLNGKEETASSGLTITGTSISGTLADPLKLGANVIEVTAIDSNGNEIIQKTTVFYVTNGGGTQYVADSNTSALWHFDDQLSNVMNDASGHGVNFVSPTTTSVAPGYIGSGRTITGFVTTTPNLTIGTRSFTVEGWAEIGSNFSSNQPFFSLSSISNDNIQLETYLNPAGDIEIYFTTPDGTFDEIVPAVFPFDTAKYHNISLVYDGTRYFSQLLLLIDGNVKAAFDFQVSCDFTENFTFQLNSEFSNSTNNAYFDEWRISNIARYTYNLGNGMNRPVIDSISPAAETTIHTATTPVSFAFHSPQQGINSAETYLTVNGVVQTGMNFTSSADSGTLAGTVALNPGANLMRLHVTDTSGQEQVQQYNLYQISKGPAAAYSADTNTSLLMHFDETSGPVLADSSANMNDLTAGAGALFGTPGVFGNALAENSSGSATANGSIVSLQNDSQITVENWFKNAPNYFGELQISNGSGGPSYFTYYFGNSGLQFQPSFSINQLSLPSSLFADGNFHHVATIIDTQNKTRNVLMVVDGNVMASQDLAIPSPMFAAAANYLTIQLGLGQAIDELRISNTARYTLNYASSKYPESKSFFSSDWMKKIRNFFE